MDLPLTEARDHFEAQGSRDALVEASGVLRTIAVGLNKISNDIRWMGSGPRTGLTEVFLPDLQPGSSIMPGKVNPVLCEAVCQVVAQVVGNDAAVAWGGADGNFELNVMLPVIARNMLESIRLIANVSRVFADRCIAGIEANVERCREYAESSPSIVTPLNHYVGYDEAGKIAKQALAERKTIREVVIERGHVPGAISEEKLDEVLDVLSMTTPKVGRDGEGVRRDRRQAARTGCGAADVLRGDRAAGRRRSRQRLAQGDGRDVRRARRAPGRLSRLLRQRHRDGGAPARERPHRRHVLRVRRTTEDRPAARPRPHPASRRRRLRRTARDDSRRHRDKGVRSIIVVDIERISDSCGFSVPLHAARR